MESIFNYLAGDWGIIRYVAGFLILPFLYFRDSTIVHLEFNKAFDNDSSESIDFDELIRIKHHLYFFQLDWWLVGTITVFIVSVFLLGDVISYSEYFAYPFRTEAAESAGGAINAFGLFLALGASFYVSWKKSRAMIFLTESRLKKMKVTKKEREQELPS